jgi:hypothetical protein
MAAREERNDQQDQSPEPASALAQDAEALLSALPVVERLLDGLSLADTSRGSSLSEGQRRFIRPALRLMSVLVGEKRDWITRVLSEANLPDESVQRICAFAGNYAPFQQFLARMASAERGNKNEFTNISYSPNFNLKAERIMLGLEIFSYDCLLLSAEQEIGDVFWVVRSLADAVCATLEQAKQAGISLNPDLLGEKGITPLAEHLVRLADLLALDRDHLDKLRKALSPLVADASPVGGDQAATVTPSQAAHGEESS